MSFLRRCMFSMSEVVLLFQNLSKSALLISFHTLMQFCCDTHQRTRVSQAAVCNSLNTQTTQAPPQLPVSASWSQTAAEQAQCNLCVNGRAGMWTVRKSLLRALEPASPPTPTATHANSVLLTHVCFWTSLGRHLEASRHKGHKVCSP